MHAYYVAVHRTIKTKSIQTLATFTYNYRKNDLGFLKQDNNNDTCAANVEHIIFRLANNAVNEITEKMTCSKPRVNASGSCKRNDTYMLMRSAIKKNRIIKLYFVIDMTGKVTLTT